MHEATLPVARMAQRDFRGMTDDAIRLDYEGRFLRRRRLVAEGGTAFLADLPEATSLNPGDALALSDGRHVAVLAAVEPVLVITGPLTRLAWHIGNRHTPCQIKTDRLVIRQDHVLEDMLKRLGATVARAEQPFSPEGGAYGHGRTFGHDHGHAHADHGHPHHHHG